MEKLSPSSALVSEDDDGSGNLNGPNLQSSLRTCHVVEDVSVNELGKNLEKFLQIQENQKLGSSTVSCQISGRIGECNIQKVDCCEDTNSAVVSFDRCLSKCATFLISGEKPIAAMEGIETTAEKKESSDVCVDQKCQRSVSLPSPVKVVSAMKGSREKQGMKPITKLTVTWAPDVYDPIPAPSTVVRIRRPRHKSESKKNGAKSKHKIKPSKGGSSSSSSKDKKKTSPRKYVGSSSKCYPLPDEEGKNRVVVTNVGGFDVGNSSSLYCGSSFLEKSVAKLHFPVAEAS